MNICKQQVAQLVDFLKNGKQYDYYKWFLDNGKEFKAIELTESFLNEIKRYVSFRAPIKQCFYNAQRLCEYSNGKILYYEGLASTKEVGIPFDHGWNVYLGKVVDLTYSGKKIVFKKDLKHYREEFAKNIIGEIEVVGDEYFGVNIPLSFIRKNWAETGMAEQILLKYFLSK